MDARVTVGFTSGGARVAISPGMANRHGLVAGATGTGKTVTLQALAEGFSRLGVPVIAAADDDEAYFLASSTFQRVLGILTGQRRPLQPPVADYLARLGRSEVDGIADFLAAAVIGGPASVRDGLEKLQAATGADEMMFVSDIFDPELRLRSLSIVAEVCAA